MRPCGMTNTEFITTLKAITLHIVSAKRFTIHINLKQGDATYRLRASDLTEGYVNFNKSE